MKSFVQTFLLLLCTHFSFAQPTSSAQEEISNYLQSKGDAHLNYIIISDNYDKSSGIWKIQALQVINGIKYNDGILLISKGHYNHTNIIDNFTRKLPSSVFSGITPETAVLKSLEHHKVAFSAKPVINFRSNDNSNEVQFDKLASTSSDINARLLYIKDEKSDGVMLTWQSRFHTLDQQNFWVTYLDPSNGRIIKTEDLVVHCDFGGGHVYDACEDEQKIMSPPVCAPPPEHGCP